MEQDGLGEEIKFCSRLGGFREDEEDGMSYVLCVI